MAEFSFTVPGPPVSWKRPRGGDGWRHTDPKDQAHRDKIRAAARNAGIRRPWHGAVYLAVTFYTALPILDRRTGDRDNLLKSVQDSLTGFAVRDDIQFVDGPVKKVHDSENPRTEITVREIP